MDDWANGTGQRSDYVSYLLRLWRDDGSDVSASQQPMAPWRASLENPHTGKRLGFASLEALFAYLREETGSGSALLQQGCASKSFHNPGTWVLALWVCLFALLIACSVPVEARDAAAQVAPPSSTSGTLGVAAGTGSAYHAASSQQGESRNVPGPDGVRVTLSASHETISWDERDPARARFSLPLLTLRRGRAATPAAQRTLMISITGLPAASEIMIEASSHHKDVRTGEPHRIITAFVLPNHPCTVADPCVVEWTLDPDTVPSDLYYVVLRTGTGPTLWENTGRPAFVILDIWDIGLGARQGRTYSARVYYGTLFPFARGQGDWTARLSSDQVVDFIEQQFLPIIADTWRTQAEEWGFGEPLHPAWDSDGVIEVIITPPPFALFDGTGTYSVLADGQGSPYPERRIWWLSTSDSFGDYASLADGYKAVFAHEFFHLMQWNVLLNTGRATSYWQYAFIEGQGMFVPSAQYPELALHRDGLTAEQSLFAARASGYLARRLNGSWREMETDGEHRYDAALYWRFLYEAYGDMEVVRIALEEMARHHSTDILTGMHLALDATFARLGGPFRNFEESLIAFSRANYALRLENGRCAVKEPSECAGRYYDPERMYGHPVLETHIQYDGFGRAYKGAIPSSYGMDLLEVGLEAQTQGQPLTVRFRGAGGVARFNLQIWRLKWGESGPQAVTSQPEAVGQEADGAYVYRIPDLDTTAYDRLALIITRLDGDESVDPIGAYHVTIGS